MEKRMWQSEQKLIDTQGKLTSANLELQKLRGAADTCAHELSMAKRIQERGERRIYLTYTTDTNISAAIQTCALTGN